MEVVPFSHLWAGSETKLDLKGLYRRPCPEHGGITITGPLPLRRHNDYAAKGYSFVSLATWDDVSLVAGNLRAEGVDLQALRKSYGAKQPYAFRTDLYLQAERVKGDAYRDELQAKVDKYGLETVIDMMRMQDPAFVMPEGVVAKSEPKKAAK